MKPSTYRRTRRRAPSHETGVARKENRQQSFFGDASPEAFFQPQASIQRKCEKCEEEHKEMKQTPGNKELKTQVMAGDKQEKKDVKEEDKKLQAKEAGPGASAPVSNTTGYVSTLGGGGSALPASLQSFYSSRLNYDFSQVKIHTGSEAEQSAKSINAQAYTYGNHIVFGNGKYSPETNSGKQLLAHELTHVMQQSNANVDASLHRKGEEETVPEQPAPLPPVMIEVEGSQIQNTTHNADCNGVSVSGNTTANYTSTGALSGRPTQATDCSGCAGTDCITVSATVVSTFGTAPVVSLPPVPGGLNACERTAVRAFINGTLNQHEQQHVAAFNTYRGTVRTPFTYTGCRAGLAAEVQAVHDNIEVPRRAASDALSAALDANGANVFNVTCECPDPPAAVPKGTTTGPE